MFALHKFEPLEAAVSLLYPPVCAICGKNVRAGDYLCNQCEAKVVRIVAPFSMNLNTGAKFTCVTW
jgi:hypothetical protein